MRIKKFLKVSCFIFVCFSCFGFVAFPGGGGETESGYTPDCTEYFTTSDTGDVAGNSNFEAEADTGADLAITSNVMVYTLDDNTETASYVEETSCFGDAQSATIKWVWKVSGTSDWSTGEDNMLILKVADSDGFGGGNLFADFRIELNASGHIQYGTCYIYDDTGDYSPGDVDISGETLTSNLNSVVYLKRETADGNQDGVVYWKLGGTVVCNETSVENNVGVDGIDRWRAGMVYTICGDDVTPQYMYFDSFEYYDAVDAR